MPQFPVNGRILSRSRLTEPWALGYLILNPANYLASQHRTGRSSDTDRSPQFHTPLYKEAGALRSGASEGISGSFGPWDFSESMLAGWQGKRNRGRGKGRERGREKGEVINHLACDSKTGRGRATGLALASLCNFPFSKKPSRPFGFSTMSAHLPPGIPLPILCYYRCITITSRFFLSLLPKDGAWPGMAQKTSCLRGRAASC